MKPYAKLTRADLQQSPIWEWLLDDDATASADAADESYVAPTELTEIPKGVFSQFIVAAAIELKSGDIMPGMVDVTSADGAISIQPTTVFLLDRHLPIPGVETNRLLSRYTRSLDNCPVGWRLSVPVEGESDIRRGEIKHGDMQEILQMGVAAMLALKNLRKP